MFDFIIQEVKIDHQMAYYNYQGGHCSHESHDYHKNDYQTLRISDSGIKDGSDQSQIIIESGILNHMGFLGFNHQNNLEIITDFGEASGATLIMVSTYSIYTRNRLFTIINAFNNRLQNSITLDIPHQVLHRQYPCEGTYQEVRQQSSICMAVPQYHIKVLHFIKHGVVEYIIQTRKISLQP